MKNENELMTMIAGKLLIVEDDQDLSKVLQEILSKICFEVHMAEDGLYALELMKKIQFNCVLSDIKMPRMDGLALIKEARNKGHNMPFIFYTGHGNRDLLLEVVKYGVFDFISKPNMDSIEDAVSRALCENINNTSQEKLDPSELLKYFSSIK